MGYSPWGLKESDPSERLHFRFSLSCIGEGNGNPLQCSCLENPRDGGAWWAAVYGVAQSRTRLKRLSSSSRKKRFLCRCQHNYVDLVLDACGCRKIFPQIGGLKQEKLILSHFLMLEIQNQGADRAASFWWFRAFLGCGRRLLISASVFTWSVPFLCVCVCVCVSFVYVLLLAKR